MRTVALLLSVCIPTYNRINELNDLVSRLLTLSRQDFEIVIVDNLSTDGTQEEFSSYPDKRVRYYRNEKALAPFANMIHSVFAANAKYALYCNDRDLIYPEALPELMTYLAADDYSFVHGRASIQYTSDTPQVFQKGYDSLMHQSFVHHPTGMIFNHDLISQYLHEEDYLRYIQYINTYDFLMLDLLKYEKSAIINCGYWSPRPNNYLKTHRSGTNRNDPKGLYFSPETREKMMQGFSMHILRDVDYMLSEEQIKSVADKLYIEFCGLICKYKSCMADSNEMAHYGMKPQFISTLQMLITVSKVFERNFVVLQKGGMHDSLIQYLRNRTNRYRIQTLKNCLKIDAIWLSQVLRTWGKNNDE